MRQILRPVCLVKRQKPDENLFVFRSYKKIASFMFSK